MLYALVRNEEFFAHIYSLKGSSATYLFKQSTAFFGHKLKPAPQNDTEAAFAILEVPNSKKIVATQTPSSRYENVTVHIRNSLEQDSRFSLRSALQRREWKGRKVSFITGHGNCVSVCASTGGACARDWFVHVDRCALALAAFADATTCATSTAPSVPSEKDSFTVFVGGSLSDPPTCEADPPPGARRLCPCVPAKSARPPPPPGMEAVGVEVSLALQREIERTGGGRWAEGRDQRAADTPKALLASLEVPPGRLGYVKATRVCSRLRCLG